MTNGLLLKMALEIVSCPIENVDLNHSYVNVYQRVSSPIRSDLETVPGFWPSGVSSNNFSFRRPSWCDQPNDSQALHAVTQWHLKRPLQEFIEDLLGGVLHFPFLRIIMIILIILIMPCSTEREYNTVRAGEQNT